MIFPRRSVSLWVRAFSSTTTSALGRRQQAAFALQGAFGRQYQQQGASSMMIKPLVSFSSTARGASQVEDDVDSTVDDILYNLFDEEGEDDDDFDDEDDDFYEENKTAPKAAVEAEFTSISPEDLKDPNFLSTSNPRWVEQMGLDQAIIDILSGKGITHFTPVQAEAFDPVVAGRDVIGRSRTGTGKTLAFGLPSMTRLVKLLEAKGMRNKRGRPVGMLVLCPTRELARQVQEELAMAAKPLGLYVDVFHGGVSYTGQARALKQGLDILVGTPGRVIDHINQGNLNLSDCEIAVLDEADEMLNMGFADDVEVILKGIGSRNEHKTQCLLFSATTPPWVKEIGREYQSNVVQIDATGETTARVASTVRHVAIQVPPGPDSKKSILEDIIAVEISKDMKAVGEEDSDDEEDHLNPIAAAARAAKQKSSSAVQQKIFGKTIVFTQTKREADELVSGGIFKSLTAQALHGDVGQKQRDATLAAFRAGAFNVLVATDVAARGIDIQDVDLVIQFDPPRDVDTYVHRSGRTGRAGRKGVSILLFNRMQQRDIVRIERDLKHGFKFDLAGPPSVETALKAAAKTSAVASAMVPDDISKYFKESANQLLSAGTSPEDIIAKCLAAISKRTTEVQSRSLITGEVGLATVEMNNVNGRPINAGDVMFTVGKLSRMSRREEGLSFDSEVGKINANPDTGVAHFDMGVEDAKRLVEFAADIDAGGNRFKILHEMEIERDQNFGRDFRNNRGRGGRFNDNSRGGGRGRFNGRRQDGGYGGGGGYRRSNSHNNFRGQNRRSDHEFRGPRGRRGGEGGEEGGYRGNSRSGNYRGGGGGRSSPRRYESDSW